MRSSERTRLKNKRILNIILLVFSFSLIFLGVADFGLLRSARMNANDFAAPVVDVVLAPVRGLQTMFNGIRTVASLRAENLRLRDENTALRRDRRRAEILESDNLQLRSVTGAVTEGGRVPHTARAVTAPGGAFAHTVLVTGGRENGIEVGNPVSTLDGLVGIVVDVGKSHSRVLMITDINAQIPVILASSSWPAVTAGNNGSSLQLRFLPEDAEPVVGDLVITSGHGGILPPGIAVGRVDLVTNGFIRVRPTVDLRKISYVTIQTGGLDGFDSDFQELALEDFYTPLPQVGDTRLFEGVNSSGGRQ